jgi:type VI protein secretion system component VasK
MEWKTFSRAVSVAELDDLDHDTASDKGELKMNLAEAISVIVGGAATALTVIGAYTSWVYRRGQHSGRAEAEREAGQRAQAEAAEKVKALEAQLAAIQAELNSLRPKRPRT